MFLFFFSRRRRHTRCALVTGVQTCALPILTGAAVPIGNFAHPYLGGSSRMSSRLKSRIRTFAGLSSERIASPTQYTFSLGNPRWRKNATHFPSGDMVNSFRRRAGVAIRSEEHTSELQSLMRISYAVFCLKKKNQK